MSILFTKAVKFESKGKLEISGPSGSGKTWTALSIARAIGGKIAVLDTEHGSASKYSDLFDFDVFTMEPPYHPDRYVEAILAATDAGYTTLIIDSLSHAWFGVGGLLEIVEDFTRASKSGNSYAAWRKGTPIQLAMVEAILSAPMHVIATMRSKTEYILEIKDGKTVPRKIGMAPIQREGMEYEFDVQAEMNWDNDFIVTKTRCPGLTGKVLSKPTGKDICDILLPWLIGAPAPKPVAKPPQPEPTPVAKPQPAPPPQQEAPAQTPKVMRPWPPEIVKGQLAMRVRKVNKPGPAPGGMRGLFVGKIGEALQDKSEQPRHLALQFLFDQMHSGQLSEGQVSVGLSWLTEHNDVTNDWELVPVAIKELNAIVEQERKAAGQADLPGVGTP